MRRDRKTESDHRNKNEFSWHSAGFSPASSRHWAKSGLFPESSTVWDAAVGLKLYGTGCEASRAGVNNEGEVFCMVSKRIYSKEGSGTRDWEHKQEFIYGGGLKGRVKSLTNRENTGGGL